MQTKCLLSSAAISGSAKVSRSITWHQWQLAYPMESRTGLSSAAARDHASSPHGYQSVGLDALRSRYGLVSSASRFGIGWKLTPCRPCYPGSRATPAGSPETTKRTATAAVRFEDWRLVDGVVNPAVAVHGLTVAGRALVGREACPAVHPVRVRRGALEVGYGLRRRLLRQVEPVVGDDRGGRRCGGHLGNAL